MRRPLTCVEICAGAGGQALGLAMAGFVHVALVEYEQEYCNVLKANRPEWNVICAGVILIMIPTLIVFLALQKYIYNGFTAGAVK